MKELEYIQTLDMSTQEVKEWEKDNMGVSIPTDTDGVLEMQKTEWYSTDANLKMMPSTGRPVLYIAMYDGNSEEELYAMLSERADIRRLRDFLNNYLEIYSNTKSNFKED